MRSGLWKKVGIALQVGLEHGIETQVNYRAGPQHFKKLETSVVSHSLHLTLSLNCLSGFNLCGRLIISKLFPVTMMAQFLVALHEYLYHHLEYYYHGLGQQCSPVGGVAR